MAEAQPPFEAQIMKITMNIECSPEEARRFLGLPDVASIQAEIMEEFRGRMMEGMTQMDSEALLKSWVSAAGGGWEEAQKAFWSQFGSTGTKDAK